MNYSQFATAEHLDDGFHNAMTACTEKYTCLLKVLDGLFANSLHNSPIISTFNINICRRRCCGWLGFSSGLDLILENFDIRGGDKVSAMKYTFICVSRTINATRRAIAIVRMQT
jgi:hypothetical protein